MTTDQCLAPIEEPVSECAADAVARTESAGSLEDGEEPCAAPDRSLEHGLQPERPLEEGACVCFFTGRGQLVVVRANGRFWELHPITVGHTSYDADGNQRLQFYPQEAIFTVMKRGRHVGFSSLAAEGRTLQAVRGDDSPHRINNHNFGDWESWEQGPEGLTNVKWRKPLALEVREVRSVAVQDLKGAQRSHLRSVRQMQKKVQAADSRIAEAERRVKEALRSSQRQQTLHQKEVTHLRGRLESALKSQQKRELETMQTGAIFKDTEARFSKLMSEKDALENAAGQDRQRYEDLQREMQVIRERHDAEMHRLELAHSSEMNALTREKDLEVKHAKTQYEEQLSKMRVDLGSKAQMKDSQITELEASLGGTLREKDVTISELMDQVSRLQSALKTIKGQVEQAHMARMSMEAGNMSISPVVSPPAPIRVSPALRPRSRAQSRTSSHRSGRSSADPIMSMNPATSPIAITPQGVSRFQGGLASVDRSGARAPTPNSPASLFVPRPVSPSSNHSGKNPPAGADADLSDEGQAPPRVPSLVFSFAPEDAEASSNVEREGGAGQDSSAQNQALLDSHNEPSLTLRESPSDDNESDNSFQSATEEVEVLDGAQKVARSFSLLQKDVQGAADAPASGRVSPVLHSFPISSGEISF